MRLVKTAQAGKVIGKAELEGIMKLKDDIIRRDLASDRQASNQEEKVEFQLDQLVKRVDAVDNYRLNDVEASLMARIQDIAGILERVNQLEKRATSTAPSPLQQPVRFTLLIYHRRAAAGTASS